MGRDAWIDTKKRACIKEINDGLKNGQYTEDFLRSHVENGDMGIVHGTHLNHEEITSEDLMDGEITTIVNNWINSTAGSDQRSQYTKDLKEALERQYPTSTTDLNQLEESLLRIAKAKIESEIETLDIKLNILDIGRIERGN